MSAPYEVFRIVDDRDPVGTCAYSEKDLSYLVHVTATRYLRADLRCGECAYHNRRDCPTPESVQQGMGIWVYQWPHTRYACMAFRPKEKL